MDKKPSRKLKKKPLPVELLYQQVQLDNIAIPALDRAFDIFFDEIQRRRESRVGGVPAGVLTPNDN